MSWRATDEWPDGLIVPNPNEVASTLAEAARPTGHRSPGEGRRMRKLGRTLVALLQVALLAFMVLVPAGTFAGKPAADPAASTTQVESGKGKSAEAKAKKGSAEAETSATSTEAKPGKGSGGAEAPPKKGSGSETKGKSSEKGKSGEKGAQGQAKKAAAAAASAAETVTAASGEPTITSDKPDYPPGGKVVLTGTNWQGDETSGVRIVVNDDVGQSWSRGVIVDVANDGTIKDQFRLPDWFVATYSVTATGLDSGRVAKTSFTDASIGTYDQCSNDDGDGYATGNQGCRWINGNLNANNSTYHEGDATVQRLWLTGLTPGDVVDVTFEYGTTKGGKHAYDYLTNWNYSETYADLCDGIAGCTNWPTTTAAIPNDPNPAFTAENPDVPQPAGRFFLLGNATAGSVIDGPEIASGSYAGDSETSITVQFTVGSDSDACATKQGTTTCSVGIWFGAHVALTTEWASGGATAVPGSPYHVSLEALDGESIGQRDNQMQTGAIFVPFNLVIIKNTIGGNDTFGYTVTGDGLNDFDLTTVGGTDSQTFADLTAGTDNRTVTEDPPPPPADWDFTSLSCELTVTGSGDTDFSTTDTTVTISESGEGDTLTCTYTNTLGAASLTITKTPDIEDVCTGSSTLVTYTYLVTNTGDVDLVVDVVDDNGTPGVAGDDVEVATDLAIAAGANQSFTYGFTLSGSSTNIATATGTSAGAQTATATATATVTGHVCTITVTKTADDDAVCTGGSTTYDITVTNNSDEFTWTGDITDDVLGDIELDVSILPGETKTYSDIPSGALLVDTTNIVTADGAFDDPASSTATETATDTVTVEDCTITVTKTADDDAVCTGGSTTYDITVTNNSDEFTWTGDITDDVLGDIELDVSILPGETKTYSDIPSGALLVDTTNIVTADGAFDDPASSTATETATDTVTVEDCTITVTKTADDDAVCTGGSTTYDITVTNNSDEFTWTGDITDDVLGDIELDVSILPGETKTYSDIPSGALLVDTTNIVTADGAFDDPASSTATETATDTVTVEDCTITVTKTADDDAVCTGGSTTYDITVTNNSDEFTWTGDITDDVLGDIELDVSILPGETKTYSDIPSGALLVDTTNIVTADGAFDDPASSTATETATDTVTVEDCTITVTKTADDDAVCTGGSTTYDITVTNNSDEFTWTGDITDDVLGDIELDVSILPGETKTYSDIPSGALLVDTTNIVTADGAFDDPASSTATETATDTVTVEDCTISLTKTPDATDVCNGTTVTYTYAITNNSDEFTWTGTIVDDMLGAINGTITLTPGETETFTASQPITGTVHNIATASGAFDDPATTSAGATADATVIGHECGQGCTPGFWQGGVGIQLWNLMGDTDWTSHGGAGTNPFIQSQSFVSFFPSSGNTTVDNMSMLAIVGSGGTNVWPRKAARDLIAAYLNRSFLGSSYPYSLATILADWTLAVSQGTDGFKSFHAKYGAANSLGCPISNTLIQ